MLWTLLWWVVVVIHLIPILFCIIARASDALAYLFYTSEGFIVGPILLAITLDMINLLVFLSSFTPFSLSFSFSFPRFSIYESSERGNEIFVWRCVAEIVVAALLLYRMKRKVDPQPTNLSNLDGKVAIITGSNTGIGFEAAKAFAELGAQVVIASRDKQKVRNL